VIALLLVALGVALAILIPGLHPDKTFSLTVGKPTIVTEQQLRQYGADNGTVYWAGAEADQEYELTRSSAGATFIRYLPKGVKAGSEQKYLTVATYPEENGYSLLQESVNSKTLTAQKTKSGALVVINPQTVQSTYFSFPKANFQVEVFSPTSDQSKDLVLQGKIDILGAK
jgi:hypothetical protein